MADVQQATRDLYRVRGEAALQLHRLLSQVKGHGPWIDWSETSALASSLSGRRLCPAFFRDNVIGRTSYLDDEPPAIKFAAALKAAGQEDSEALMKTLGELEKNRGAYKYRPSNRVRGTDDARSSRHKLSTWRLAKRDPKQSARPHDLLQKKEESPGSGKGKEALLKNNKIDFGNIPQLMSLTNTNDTQPECPATTQTTQSRKRPAEDTEIELVTQNSGSSFQIRYAVETAEVDFEHAEVAQPAPHAPEATATSGLGTKVVASVGAAVSFGSRMLLTLAETAYNRLAGINRDRVQTQHYNVVEERRYDETGTQPVVKRAKRQADAPQHNPSGQDISQATWTQDPRKLNGAGNLMILRHFLERTVSDVRSKNITVFDKAGNAHDPTHGNLAVSKVVVDYIRSQQGGSWSCWTDAVYMTIRVLQELYSLDFLHSVAKRYSHPALFNKGLWESWDDDKRRPYRRAIVLLNSLMSQPEIFRQGLIPSGMPRKVANDIEAIRQGIPIPSFVEWQSKNMHPNVPGEFPTETEAQRQIANENTSFTSHVADSNAQTPRRPSRVPTNGSSPVSGRHLEEPICDGLRTRGTETKGILRPTIPRARNLVVPRPVGLRQASRKSRVQFGSPLALLPQRHTPPNRNRITRPKPILRRQTMLSHVAHYLPRIASNISSDSLIRSVALSPRLTSARVDEVQDQANTVVTDNDEFASHQTISHVAPSGNVKPSKILRRSNEPDTLVTRLARAPAATASESSSVNAVADEHGPRDEDNLRATHGASLISRFLGLFKFSPRRGEEHPPVSEPPIQDTEFSPVEQAKEEQPQEQNEEQNQIGSAPYADQDVPAYDSTSVSSSAQDYARGTTATDSSSPPMSKSEKGVSQGRRPSWPATPEEIGFTEYEEEDVDEVDDTSSHQSSSDGEAVVSESEPETPALPKKRITYFDHDDALIPGAELRMSAKKEEELAAQVRQMQEEKRKAEEAERQRIIDEENERLRILEEKRRREEEERRKKEEERRRKEEERTGLRPPKSQLIQSLSADWISKVQHTQKVGEGVGLGKTPDGTTLRKRDFATVLPANKWLNDEIINGALAHCGHAINEAAGVRSRENPKCVAVTSLFWSSMSKKPNGPAGFGLRTYSRMGMKKDSFLDIETVLIPVNKSLHWTLLVIRPRLRRVIYVDSMGGQAQVEVDRAFDMVKVILGDKYNEDEWEEDHYVSPRQVNGVDCGVHTITNGICIALGINPSLAYRVEELPLQRLRIAAVLLNQGWTGDFDFGGL